MYKLIMIEAGPAFTEREIFRCYKSGPVWDLYISKMKEGDSASELCGIYVTDKAGTFIDPPTWVWEDLKALPK